MIDWKIQSRSHACQACSTPFEDKQEYYTLLFDKRHELERLDVCPKCWAAQYGSGVHDRKGFVSFWQGQFTTPVSTTAPDPIHKESAESLLRKLMEQNEPQYAAACFILAVMLERKRVFKMKAQTTQDGQRQIVYEHIKTGDVFSVVDPNLQLKQLEDVQRQVSTLMEEGFGDASHKVAEPAPQAEPPVAETTPETPPSAVTPSEGESDMTQQAGENDTPAQQS